MTGDPEADRRPRWRNRRWRAAAVFSLFLPAVLYPLAYGPSLYLTLQHPAVLPAGVHGAVFRPVTNGGLADSALTRAVGYDRYCHWWLGRALRGYVVPRSPSDRF